ncbi:sterol esterase [Crassisporium funariophilum]|nr:sterol esterase [Crassisporium funariophilum]
MHSTPVPFASLILLISLVFCASAEPTGEELGDIVNLSYGSFRGQSTGNLTEFLGIPYASPPVGKLRFAAPVAPVAFEGVRPATSFGAACPQQSLVAPQVPGLDLSGLFSAVPAVTSEDCLSINVVKPADIKRGEKLPVVFWIYGGAFAVGGTSTFSGNTLVERSIALGVPVIYVSANYRLNAFGFLGGKEVKAAGIGNAGLRDQRFALLWVQDHIASFGGDPAKVTIWGESAGAISVGLHMVLDEGNPGGLFHGAFMESGSPSVLPDITEQQKYFDQLVGGTNCSSAADALTCLRDAPFDKLMAAMNEIPSFLSFQTLDLAWVPMVDGDLIVRDPLASLLSHRFAKVIPFVTGDCEDEGTLFALPPTNITTNDEFLGYMQENFFPNISAAQFKELELAYPDDITQGSPFNSGTANALTPQYKRLAAVLGDYEFQAPRRFLLEIASATQAAYAFRYLRGPSTPILGAFHSTDIQEFYGITNNSAAVGMDALVYFVNSGNPNAPRDSTSLLRHIQWKTWSSSPTNPPLLTFIDPAPSVNITSDTYRADAMKVLSQLTLTKAVHKP